MPLLHFVYLGIFLFSVGVAIVIIKRNAIMILMGIELMLNAANLNLVAFNQHPNVAPAGEYFAVFIIVVAVCEAAIGLAIIYQIYRHFSTSNADQITDLKE